MTTAEINAAIAAGTMTVTRLPAAQPRRRDLVMSRVGGSRSALHGSLPDGSKSKSIESSFTVAKSYRPARRGHK